MKYIKYRFLHLLVLLCCFHQSVLAQDVTADTLAVHSLCRSSDKEHRFRVTQVILPAALLGTGFLALDNGWLESRNESIGNSLAYTNHRCKIDNVTAVLPAAAAWGLNLCGVKARHNVPDLTVMMGTSYAFLLSTTWGLKKATHELRPDGSTYDSFPSGHTAIAFCGAHYLWKEYKDVSPWIGIAGYAVAAGTGVLRIYNNRHWCTDVLAGAGWGILSAEVGYWLYPVIQKALLKNKTWRNLVAGPGFQRDGISLNAQLTF